MGGERFASASAPGDWCAVILKVVDRFLACGLRRSCRRVPPRGRWRWAELLRRLCEVELLRCPQCQGLMQIVAVLTDPTAITRIHAPRATRLGDQWCARVSRKRRRVALRRPGRTARGPNRSE